MPRTRKHGNGEAIGALQQAQLRMFEALANMAQNQTAQSQNQTAQLQALTNVAQNQTAHLQALANLAQNQTAMMQTHTALMARMSHTDNDIADIRRDIEGIRERLDQIEGLLADLPEAVHRRFGFSHHDRQRDNRQRASSFQGPS